MGKNILRREIGREKGLGVREFDIFKEGREFLIEWIVSNELRE